MSRDKVSLPRRARGKRPYFFDDPAVDQLHAMVLALSAELSVAFDRIDTLERLLGERGVLEREAIENYRPDETAEAERAERRQGFVQRLLRILNEERDALESADAMRSYEATIEELNR